MLELLDQNKLSQLTEAQRKEVDTLLRENACMTFEPNGKQKEFINMVGTGEYFVNVFAAANGVGKTTIAINILINLLYEKPINSHFELPFFINFPRPVQARIISNPTAIIDKVIPELKKWLPKGTYKTSKAKKGYDYKWEVEGGGTLDLLTNEQDVTEFEAVEKNVIIPDEPLARDKFTASVSRMRKGGVIIFPMTPLLEADWVVDKFDDKNWGFVYADIEDNCIEHGIDGQLEHVNIQRMVDEYDPDEKEARAHGKFMCLAGVIYKGFNRDVHCIKRTALRPEWTYGMTVDPHPAKPFAISWWAVTNKEIIFIDEFPKEDYEKLKRVNWTLDDYVHFIREIESEFPKPVEYRFIDPNYGRTPDVVTGQILLDSLMDHDLFFEADINDDVDEGILAVKNRLKYDKTKKISGSNQPTIFFFDDLYNHIKHMSKWGYRDWKQSKGKSISERTQDKFKDFCFDDKTEILTEKGFKPFISLQNEKVGTINLNNFDLEFQKPHRYIRYRHKGDMVKIDARGVNMNVTQNHRMLIRSQLSPYSEPKIKFRFASELTPQVTIPIACNGITTTFPEDVFKLEHYSIPEKIWASFLGLYLSEGCATGTKGGKIQIPGRGYSVYISQQESSRHFKDMKSIIDKLPFHFGYNGRTFVCSNKTLWQHLFPLGNSEQKYIPNYVWKFNRISMERLWKYIHMGDGWIYKGGMRYATVSKRLADELQSLLVILGRSVSIVLRKPSDSKHKVQYLLNVKSNRFASICESGQKHQKPKYKTVSYNGEVFCVSVPNSTLITRRNSLVSIAGNCDCVRYTVIKDPLFSLPRGGPYKHVGGRYATAKR